MLRNYLTIAWRNLLRHKAFSLINILGLAIGMISLFFIVLYITHEASYDNFHPLSNRLFRVLSNESNFDHARLSTIQFSPLAKAMREQVPEINKVARIEFARGIVFNHQGRSFSENKFYWADQELLEMFQLPLKYGNAQVALRDPNSLILTQQTALKYFGRSNVLNETIRLDTLVLKITGVLQDLPTNTHFDFTMLGSYPTLKNADDPWRHQGAMYILSDGQTPAVRIAGKMTMVGKKAVWWLDEKPHFTLQPLARIHLFSANYRGVDAGEDIRSLYIFGTIAFIIVLSTVFNYINLATAGFTQRVKEIGVRKLLGANRATLIFQFLVESVLLSLIAFLIALTCLQLILPHLNQLLDTKLTRQYSFQVQIIGLFLILAFLLGVLAGGYPAFFLSRFQFHKMLKGVATQYSKWRIRQLLMITQFGISSAIFIAAVIVQQQLHFLSNTKLGFQKEQILLLTAPKSSQLNGERIKRELLNLPNIERVSIANGSPLGGGYISSEVIQGRRTDIVYIEGDEDYVRTLRMQVKEGRDFSDTRLAELDSTVLINETMASMLGRKFSIGQRIPIHNGQRIAGVVKDFHTASFHERIVPTVIILTHRPFTKTFIVCIQTHQAVSTLQQIQQLWQKALPEHPLTIAFLDEQYQALYRSEARLSTLTNIFSGLAIAVSCLGLFGLATFSTQQRTKEIGVRKVLGATIPTLLLLLSKDFIKLVLVANLISWPIAWYAVHRWLEDFSYRISPALWMFMVPTLLLLLSSQLIITIRTLKAARQNPVKALRYE